MWRHSYKGMILRVWDNFDFKVAKLSDMQAENGSFSRELRCTPVRNLDIVVYREPVVIVCSSHECASKRTIIWAKICCPGNSSEYDCRAIQRGAHSGTPYWTD